MTELKVIGSAIELEDGRILRGQEFGVLIGGSWNRGDYFLQKVAHLFRRDQGFQRCFEEDNCPICAAREKADPPRLSDRAQEF
jgi:hypothetical protein